MVRATGSSTRQSIAPQCNFFAADGCTAFVHDSALNLRAGIVEEPGCCFLKSSNATYTLLVKDAYDAFVINRWVGKVDHCVSDNVGWSADRLRQATIV